jgi:hypothetical protein
MSGDAAVVVSWLAQVQELREQRNAEPALARHVGAIKLHQHARFARDYKRLLDSPRYRRATQFFLEELYGPEDFAARDAEFGRIAPTMGRLLPREVMHTVAQLAELHALSEGLDQQMAQVLRSESVDERSYRAAWQAVGRRADREHQLELLLEIGAAMERHTSTPLLATTLRLMRGPARVAGLARLQSFLENGLSAFAAIKGASEFLATIADNEHGAIRRFFE